MIMTEIFEIATNISTPLALSGLFAAIIFFVFRKILAKEIFPRLSKATSADIIKKIIDYVFILALVAMVLGFAGFLFSRIYKPPGPVIIHKPEESRDESDNLLPSDIAKDLESGISLYDESKFEDAISMFENVLKSSPNNAVTLRYLADSYVATDKLQLALSHINHAIKEDPENAWAYKIKGRILYERANYIDAISAFQECAKRIPVDIFETFAYLADSYRLIDKRDEALLYANKAIDSNSNYDWAYWVRGMIFYRMYRDSDAISDFEKYLEFNPYDVETIDLLKKLKAKQK